MAQTFVGAPGRYFAFVGARDPSAPPVPPPMEKHQLLYLNLVDCYVSVPASQCILMYVHPSSFIVCGRNRLYTGH